MVSLAIVLLVTCVALGQGGLSPWATLLLELGAVGLVIWTILRILWRTSPEARRYFQEQQRLQKGTRPGVEVIPPDSVGQPFRNVSIRRGDYWILWGYPFKRTGLEIPLLLLTLWMVMSLVPLGDGVLASLSPQAHDLRKELGDLLGGSAVPAPAPWSLAPYMTLQKLWVWLAYLLLFYVSVCLARDERHLERLSRGLFFCGLAFGLFGIAQWFMGLQELFGADPSTAGLRASGSFGNRNHYAAFMEMFLLCGLGWLGSRWVGWLLTRSRNDVNVWRRVNVLVHEAGAKLFLTASGVVVLASALIFSLSRSGIAFGLAGCAVFALLVPRTVVPEKKRHGHRRRRALHLLLALALLVVGITAWIGLDPVVHRFQLLPDEWEKEKGRLQVWIDSWEAVQDFTFTGAGLGSFRYVFPLYRTFGGVIYYSWAHNDYLQALIELGVPGMALIIWAMVLVWRRAGFVRRRLKGRPDLVFQHAGYIAAAVSVALHSSTDFGLHMPANAALFAVVVGVIVGLEQRR